MASWTALNGRAVRRRGLLDRLRRLRAGMIVSLVAPIGSGKTRLLDEWSEVAEVRSLRLEVKGTDDPDLFDRATKALVTLLPTLRDSARAPITTGAASDEFLELLTGLGDQHLLILVDDVHLATPSQKSVLTKLAASMPRTLSLGLAGRTALKGLGGAHHEGRLLALTTSDLALTRADLANVYGSTLNKAQLSEVLKVSWGWSAALPYGLAHGHGARDQAAEEKRALQEFLADEVLAPLDGPLKDFLADAAILGHADAELLNAVRGRRDAQLWMDSLMSTPLPLVRITDGTIVVHSLVREVLGRWSHRQGGDRENRVLSAAVDRLTERRDYPRAYHFLSRQGHRPTLAKFAYERGRQLALSGQGDLVREWLDAFTPEELEQFPELQVLFMILDGAEGNFLAVSEWLAMLDGRDLGHVIAEELDQTSPTDLVKEVLGLSQADSDARPIKQGWWTMIGQLNRALLAIEDANLTGAEGILLAMAPFTRTLPLMEVWRSACLAFVHVLKNEPERGLAVLMSALPAWQRTGVASGPVTIGMDVMLALCLARTRDLPAASKHLDAALKKFDPLRGALKQRAVLIEVALAEAAHEVGRHQLAGHLAHEITKHAPHGGGDFLVARARQLGARVHDHHSLDLPAYQLTQAESKILQMLVTHQSVPTMAERIGRSPATIRSHVRRLYAKLDVHNRDDAVARASELGLLTEQRE